MFDGLLPEPHNTAILDLLFEIAHWHGLAKLRLHHDRTLDIMQAVTVSVGIKLRRFAQHTCASFSTKELPREFNSRIRRETKISKSKKSDGSDHPQTTDVLGKSDKAAMPAMAQASTSQPTSSAYATTLPVQDPDLIPNANPSIQTISESTMPNRTDVSKKAVVPSSQTTGRRRKTLNLNTYKMHSLGDYVETIRRNGTTDSYSTEPVGL